MIVKITLVLDVCEQDSTKDAIEVAKNQMRGMDFEELVEIATYIPNPVYDMEIETTKILNALKRAYFLLEKNHIKDVYFEVLRLGLGDLLPSQIDKLPEFIKTGTIT
jgi:hypothetical protein